MFKDVPSQFDFPKAEKEILAFWEANRIYEKSLEQRKGGKPFVFFEGPPTANGLPHPGHCLTRAIKDLFPRFKTMTGHYCLRKGGWDTHGLPVEVEVCKELGIHTKEEIEKYGVEAFNRKCLESVFRYTKEWEDLTRRLGFWVNLDEAYVTYHQSYVESVWWSLKQLFDAGLLYQGHKIVWWWAQGGTALSSGEVGQGYREVDDPSVYVRFPIVMDDRANKAGIPEKTSLLVWTTTPWTLPSNMYAAVHKEFDYAIVHDKEAGERLIFATALVEQIAKKVKKSEKWKVERTIKGTALVGLRYLPPFSCYYDRPATKLQLGVVDPRSEKPSTPPRGGEYKAELENGDFEYVAWRVLHADFVTLESGTGLVHEAPAFGEVDFELMKEDQDHIKYSWDVPFFCSVAPNGTFTDEGPDFCRGRWVKDCDKDIIRDLKERGLLLHQEQYRHDYPFCWRAEEDPLIQYPRKSWFIRTTQFKDAMLANNEQINWLPDHIKEGRFGNFLRDNVDWSLSRERYWGTPLPIWVCESCGQMEAIDSYESLMSKSGVAGLDVWENAKKKEPGLSEHLKVHKPYIDAITFECGECASGVMKRVPEVIDCWYDSGAMPFAQWGFPHKNREMFQSQFPADFISEALDQTRGWFYSLVAISTLLFGENGGEHGPLARANRRGVSSAPVAESLARRRRILPHWEAGGSTYFLTFRLHHGQLSEAERSIVLDACRHWDLERMHLHAAVVMPDHVHLLLTPCLKRPGEWWSIADLLHSIKGFTAQAINRGRATTGFIWQQEYFDRIIRNEDDFQEKWNYVVTNPQRKGLGDAYRWIWVESDRLAHGPEAHAPEYPLPFRNCIVLGLLMGEDGLKMSKSKKNYKEPSYIFEHEGADAMRWLFFSGQTPWTSIRFQESAIAEGQREFLIRLYNCYSFFVIYANIDKWTPQGGMGKRSLPVATGGTTGKQSLPMPPELDRWILSELAQCSVTVFDRLNEYDNFNAAKSLIAFVDALSNWYVRRSRDRFWKSEMDDDKRSAYETLHHCLVTVSKLIAPFTPFVAESMYQNLVRMHDTTAPASIHLCDYPVVDSTRQQVQGQIDARLNEEVDLIRQLVSCGRAARSAAKLRVRQPLPAVELYHRRADVIKKHEDVIKDELNLKRIEYKDSGAIAAYVTYELKPDFKKIGPKHGPLAPKIKAALAATKEVELLVKSLEQSGTCRISVGGQDVELTADEVLVELHAKEGFSAERIPGQGILVLDTHLTQDLLDEGLARDLVNQVQQVRKNLNLRYEQRIDLAIVGDGAIKRIIESFGQYIMHETLANCLLATPLRDTQPVEAEVEGHTVQVFVHPQ